VEFTLIEGDPPERADLDGVADLVVSAIGERDRDLAGVAAATPIAGELAAPADEYDTLP